MNKEINEDIVDRETFFDAVNSERKKLNINLREAITYDPETEQVYHIFGLIYGQTVGVSFSPNEKLIVKIQDKNKWLWTKIKYGL